uniref:BEL1-like homeodomain protein 4 n=1 Tax=Fragaria vesca subsp. vesca TaxID=101020 RepID=UPI0005C845EB|nr:PREDICTED: BEL1-like homeodomain protein 4 [Fragaria vesca subsp. vesca]XP_011465434.1 PREDICTED: BEL1-like homeodomain protein 4 [Fragaria vesca subsp. vesca]
MVKGVELIRKCSKVHPWASYKKYNYTIRLLGLNEYLRLQLSRLREQVSRAVNETLTSISYIKEEVKQIEGPGVIKNQMVSCEVPEPSLPTVQHESEDFDEVHPLPVPPGANQPSAQVLITTKLESQTTKRMSSEGFNNPTGSATPPEMLEHPMPQPLHQTSAAQRYGSQQSSVELGPLGESNKCLSGHDNIAAHQQLQHQILTIDPPPISPFPSAHSTSSTLHLSLPNCSFTLPWPGLHWVRPDSHGYDGGSTTSPAPQLYISNNPSDHLQQLSLSTSKYAKAAQELLEEFCSVGRGQFKRNKSDQQNSSLKPSSNPAAGTSGAGVTLSSSKDVPPTLSAAERIEHQRRKTKLLSMLDEVDRRYNHYCEQMQMVVNAFDLVMGFRAAVPYTALAQKAMSRHFRCLKDAVTAQLKHSCELLGEKDGAGNSGITKGETPRLKMLEQSLRQQRAFHQMGMMEQEAWRPQRGLPERSVNILRAWLFEHFLHPYPSDADKQLLAQRTGLSRCQVSSWFVNARVRLWKPLVEQMFQQEADEEGDVAAASVDQDQMSEQCYNTSDYPAETPMPPATTTSM